VVIATGRSAANSYPIARELDFPGENAVASNGAVSYRYDNQGFEVVEVESFDPAPVLNRLIEVIPDAHFAVEDLDGSYRFHKPFPVYALGEENFETPLEQLLHHPVSRVVVLSPSHDVEQFLTLMRQV
jgi:hydroxymethylpyrimidine pyrophosphatase-like HAD family hydrolase